MKKLEYKGGYAYLLEFDDGMRAVVDFSEFLNRGPIRGAHAWPNGADVAPETLYEKCERAGPNATHRA